MSWRTLPAANTIAATLLIGGALLVLLPERAVAILQLMLASVAVAAAVHVLVIVVPEWSGGLSWSPFAGGRRPEVQVTESKEVDRIRAMLSGRRQKLGHGSAVPPETVHLLTPVIRSALEREGLDPDDPDRSEVARAAVSPLTWSVLRTEPQNWLPWYRGRRASDAATAEVVHHVLDDLERFAKGGYEQEFPSDPTRQAS